MSEMPEWLSERQIRVSRWLPQNPDMNIIKNLKRLMNIDLTKIKNSIQSRPDLMNTLQQISREISDNNKFQFYHNFLASLRAVVKFKSTITHNIDRPELKFDRNRNFVNRQILLMKMTTRLIIIILDCAFYISTFKAVIVVTAAL